MLSDLKEGGTFLLNCDWSVEELEEKLPAKMKRLLQKEILNSIPLTGIHC